MRRLLAEMRKPPGVVREGIAQVELPPAAGKASLQFGPLGGLVATEMHGGYGIFRTGGW
jgi:hypothetical protein